MSNALAVLPRLPQHSHWPAPASGTNHSHQGGSPQAPLIKPWPILFSSSSTTPFKAMAIRMPQEKPWPVPVTNSIPFGCSHPAKVVAASMLWEKPWPMPMLVSAPVLFQKPLGRSKLHMDTSTQGYTFKARIGNCFA